MMNVVVRVSKITNKVVAVDTIILMICSINSSTVVVVSTMAVVMSVDKNTNVYSKNQM